MKWEDYFLKQGTAFSQFWREYISSNKRDILFIMGMGFDPRTNVCIQDVFSNKGDGMRNTCLLRYYKSLDNIGDTPTPEVQSHLDDLAAFLQKQGHPTYQSKDIVLYSEDNKSVASITATQLFNQSDVSIYSDVIVDISAMPRGVFLPILNKLLLIIDDWNKNNTTKKNLHVVVTENSELDSQIHDRGEADEAIYIHGLGLIETAKTKDSKEIWIALLGEGQTKQFNVIRKEINPVDICAVLPFPSKNLKRGDDLVLEYQDLLFNDNSFDPKNIIYVDERNPFQAYRLLYRAMIRYDRSLKILDGSKIIVTVLSSKLLTVGAFLAVYETRESKINVGIKHVESLGHEFDDGVGEILERILKHNNLVHLWLMGTPYE